MKIGFRTTFTLGLMAWVLVTQHQTILSFLPVNPLSFLSPVQSSEPSIRIDNTILEKVKGLADLTTVEYSIQLVIPVEQKGSFLWVIPDDRSLLFQATGKVKAGISLSALTPDSFKITSGGEVYITLPSAQIQDVYLDENSSKVWSYSGGATGTVTDGFRLQEEARSAAIANLRRQACESGILTQANQKAAQVIENFLLQSGAPVKVQVHPADSECR